LQYTTGRALRIERRVLREFSVYGVYGLITMELDAMRTDCLVEIDAVAWLGKR
jgi:hypothetical protein